MWSAQTTSQRKSEPEKAAYPLLDLLTSRRVLCCFLSFFFSIPPKKASIVAGHFTRVRPLPIPRLPVSCLATQVQYRDRPPFFLFSSSCAVVCRTMVGFCCSILRLAHPQSRLRRLLFLNLGIAGLAQARGEGKATREPQKLPSNIRVTTRGCSSANISL
ncbi:hypothetical protein B0T09DRAFT_91476 [Sordaria sp. MPI-SDFR-AT-0083]|nr:hypothetical protein B0T09DRAFT_91476 [Sordaria sp. MPI-SDFR-AT-0083]